jgi:hypothetical protein
MSARVSICASESAFPLTAITTAKNICISYNFLAVEGWSGFKPGNVCCHSVQKFLSSNFLSKNIKTKIYRTIIMPVVLYGCETWSLTLRKEGLLRVSENRVLSRIFEPKGNEVKGEWRKLHSDELIDLYSSPTIVRVIKSRLRWEEHVARMGRVGMYKGFWWGNLRERDHLEDPGVDGRIVRLIFRKWDVRIWTVSSWLRAGTVGRQL